VPAFQSATEVEGRLEIVLKSVGFTDQFREFTGTAKLLGDTSWPAHVAPLNAVASTDAGESIQCITLIWILGS